MTRMERVHPLIAPALPAIGDHLRVRGERHPLVVRNVESAVGDAWTVTVRRFYDEPCRALVVRVVASGIR